MAISSIEINSDLGESFGLLSFGHDRALLELIHAANIACGFHAGDPHVMAETVRAAADAGVALGAHPGLPDLPGFGRRAMTLTADEVRDIVIYQVGALAAFTAEVGKQLSHVKPHGALYGMLSRDETLMTPVAEFAARNGLRVFGLTGTAHQTAADAAGAQFVGELYVDLNYRADGSLIIVRRPQQSDPQAAADRVRSAVRTGTITADDGTPLRVDFSSICIHSDVPNCVDVARAVATALTELDIPAPSN
jgi:5-oxoprolinase (ATP-hydrolysing) subunit A